MNYDDILIIQEFSTVVCAALIIGSHKFSVTKNYKYPKTPNEELFSKKPNRHDQTESKLF